MHTLALGVPITIYHTTPRDWCTTVRRAGLNRRWDVLIPPSWLYRPGASFRIGDRPRFSIVRDGRYVVGAFVTAVRSDVACLIDIRSNGHATWFDTALDDIEQWADIMGASSVQGPVGAYPFLADGVVTTSTIALDSIHVPSPPPEIVDTFTRRGYVPCKTGQLNGRIGGVASPSAVRPATADGVIVGRWRNLHGHVTQMIAVIEASFATLQWYVGPGASRRDLMRTFAPVVDPKGMLMAVDGTKPLGAVIVYRDVRHVCDWVLRLPLWMQRIWLFAAARRSPHLHVSVAGMLPSARRSRRGLALYHAFQALAATATDVTTSWIDDRNDTSQLLTEHAGLQRLQQRQVFSLQRRRSTQQPGGTI